MTPSKHSSPDPFKDLSRPQRKPHTFQALSTFGSSSPRACLYSRLWAKKKSLCKLFLRTNTEAVQLQSSLSLQMTASPNGSQLQWRGRQPGLRGVWEAGGGLFELYGFMDGWIHGCEGKRMHGWIVQRGMTMEWEGKACCMCRKWAHGALGWTLHRLVGNY